MRGRELVDVGPWRSGMRYPQQCEELSDGHAIDSSIEVGLQCEEGSGGRTGDQDALMVGPIEGLHPEPVARKEDPSVAFIDESEGEDSLDAVENGIAPFDI